MAADKVDDSRTLETVPTARTRLERHFDPDAICELKAAADTDLLVGGPHLGAPALAAGLLDEHRFGNRVVALCSNAR